MLLTFVALYIVASIAIGLFAGRNVHDTRDYVVAGRTLPFYVVTATVFATWFGSETVLGIPAKFFEGGLGSIVEDPFGSSMCLVLVGLFFAARLYKMDLLTIGDYYRKRYNPTVELLTSLAIVGSYLGWVSAQIVALGLVFTILTGSAISLQTGIVIGTAVVLLYTLWGGMVSVAWTNFVQMVVIVIGILFIAWVIGDKAGGVGIVIDHARNAEKLKLFPEPTTRDVLWFIGAAVTMMLGSIPQQDVFQRVMSAKTLHIAVWGSVTGGVLYFLFAFVPIYLGYSAFLIDPALVESHIHQDPQHILPELILKHTPVFAQIMFFGALLSAIMSTAAGTLLAPSVTFTENILKRFLRKDLSDRQFLRTMRLVVIGFAFIVLLFALNSESSIYEMVGNAYKVTLCGAFVPLVFGLYWKKATSAGALLSIVFGIGTWLAMEFLNSEGLMPPQLAGLLAAVVWMVIGSVATQPRRRPAHHAA
jgi:SSS family solute:Na+ symporter